MLQRGATCCNTRHAPADCSAPAWLLDPSAPLCAHRSNASRAALQPLYSGLQRAALQPLYGVSSQRAASQPLHGASSQHVAAGRSMSCCVAPPEPHTAAPLAALSAGLAAPSPTASISFSQITPCPTLTTWHAASPCKANAMHIGEGSFRRPARRRNRAMRTRKRKGADHAKRVLRMRIRKGGDNAQRGTENTNKANGLTRETGAPLSRGSCG